MKFEKIGYALAIFGFGCIIYKFGDLILLNTDYLITGKKETLRVVSQEAHDGEFIYQLKATNGIHYESVLTPKNLSIGSEIKMLTGRITGRAFFGDFYLILYLMLWVVIGLGGYAAYYSIRGLLCKSPLRKQGS